MGIAPECTNVTTIKVPRNTAIRYCYSVVNTGSVTFTTHSLVDSHLGVLLNRASHTLQPGAAFSTTKTSLLTVNTTNVATWTASVDVVVAANPIYLLAGEEAQASTNATVIISSDTDDQDNDTIPDNIETADDPDRDNLPNFLDTDDDGDGKLDIDEVGSDPLHPLDLNNNNIPDYLDATPTASEESDEPQQRRVYLPLIGR